jgi:hypothetical protein
MWPWTIVLAELVSSIIKQSKTTHPIVRKYKLESLAPFLALSSCVCYMLYSKVQKVGRYHHTFCRWVFEADVVGWALGCHDNRRWASLILCQIQLTYCYALLIQEPRMEWGCPERTIYRNWSSELAAVVDKGWIYNYSAYHGRSSRDLALVANPVYALCRKLFYHFVP